MAKPRGDDPRGNNPKHLGPTYGYSPTGRNTFYVYHNTTTSIICYPCSLETTPVCPTSGTVKLRLYDSGHSYIRMAWHVSEHIRAGDRVNYHASMNHRLLIDGGWIDGP